MALTTPTIPVWSNVDAKLAASVESARLRLPSVSLDEDILFRISTLCAELGVRHFSRKGVPEWNRNIYTNNMYIEMFVNLGLVGGLAFLALYLPSAFLARRLAHSFEQLSPPDEDVLDDVFGVRRRELLHAMATLQGRELEDKQGALASWRTAPT